LSVIYKIVQRGQEMMKGSKEYESIISNKWVVNEGEELESKLVQGDGVVKIAKRMQEDLYVVD